MLWKGCLSSGSIFRGGQKMGFLSPVYLEQNWKMPEIWPPSIYVWQMMCMSGLNQTVEFLDVQNQVFKKGVGIRNSLLDEPCNAVITALKDIFLENDVLQMWINKTWCARHFSCSLVTGSYDDVFYRKGFRCRMYFQNAPRVLFWWLCDVHCIFNLCLGHIAYRQCFFWLCSSEVLLR